MEIPFGVALCPAGTLPIAACLVAFRQLRYGSASSLAAAFAPLVAAGGVWA